MAIRDCVSIVAVLGLAACGADLSPTDSRGAQSETAQHSMLSALAKRKALEVQMLIQTTPPGVAPLSQFNAFFAENNLPMVCTKQKIGECELDSCSASTGDLKLAPAGTLSIRGEITLADDGRGVSDYGGFAQAPLWHSDDQTLTLSGTGATVPKFTHVMRVPAPLTITEPAPTGSTGSFGIGIVELSRTKDVTVRWTGESDQGKLLFAIITPTGQGAQTDLFCRWDANDHVGVIPASLMKQLPVIDNPTAAVGTGVLAMSTAESKFSVGKWTVPAAATMASPIRVDGKMVSYIFQGQLK